MTQSRQERRSEKKKFEKYQRKIVRAFEADDIDKVAQLFSDYSGQEVANHQELRELIFHKIRYEHLDVSDVKRLESQEWLASRQETRMNSDELIKTGDDLPGQERSNANEILRNFVSGNPDMLAAQGGFVKDLLSHLAVIHSDDAPPKVKLHSQQWLDDNGYPDNLPFGMCIQDDGNGVISVVRGAIH